MTRDPKEKNSLNLFLNRYFNIMMVGVVLIILAAAYFLLIRPKYDSTMAAIKINIEQQQRLYADQVKKLNNLKTIASLYDKISPADLKKFNGVLPEQYVKEALYGELEEIVSQNGFILNAVTINKDEAKPGDGTEEVKSSKVGSLNLQLSVSAIDYAGFKNLLRLLENNLRLFDVTKVSFNPGGNTAMITLTTYYYNK